ncbi:hypothetical protein Tsubulata_026603 [Turnera subulata]|uniref:Factor of DNA methylation 1-5/IDN2 domain-containing protein n=1 Tax=Turnera subulata TaxID=218843 RepID=A0A9Q0JEN7_9ROSI|nr:hypothetical protein Tsubulata_026603 [Turnera subulata]
MDHSSEEDTDISESEIDDHMVRPYEDLKTGKLKLKVHGFLRCPFCLGKRKRDYKYKDLLQHASGVSTGSANRSAKQKAKHLALAKYLQIDLANEAEQAKQVVPRPVNRNSEQDELFVKPWSGVISKKVKDHEEISPQLGATYWLKKYARFKPLEAYAFWREDKQTIEAILTFENDRPGFANAMAFQSSFDAESHGKKDWEQKTYLDSSTYGWFARAADYHSDGPMGEYLRNQGKWELATFSSVNQKEAEQKTSTLADLAEKIDTANLEMDHIQYKVNKTAMTLERLLEDTEKLQSKLAEEREKIQSEAREKLQRLLDERDRLAEEWEYKRRELDERNLKLNKKEALTALEKQKLDEEKKKNAVRDSSLHLASLEKEKADKNFLRLVEEKKREKQEAMDKFLKLEKELAAKQKLEMEIQDLRGKLQVMKQYSQDNAANQSNMKELEEELASKVDDMSSMESLNQILIVKERGSNDELQEARKVLIEGWPKLLSGRPTNIGIKRMGEIDANSFQSVCREKFKPDDVMIEAATLCSLWQEHLKDPHWHPFKVITEDGKEKEILDEEDEKLKSLKQEWKDEAYTAVVNALQELNEYNPSGRYVIQEFWNFKEGRKATLKEVIAHAVKDIKNCKRKKR